jgi:hypothetical protein
MPVCGSGLWEKVGRAGEMRLSVGMRWPIKGMAWEKEGKRVGDGS